MICTNAMFTVDQWELFNRYQIKTPIEGEKYTVRKKLNTRRGKAYLLNEIVNPNIPNGTPEPEGGDMYFEPSWGTWRFKEENEVIENVLQLENAA